MADVTRMAFELPADADGLSMRAYYTQGHGAFVEVLHNGRAVWQAWPDGYKVWNYAAHADQLLREVRRQVFGEEDPRGRA